MDRFRFLPEGCISKILSLTSPKDAARASAVSQTFMSAAESDVVWETFLPSDYQQIISGSGSLMNFASKKELYLSLCNSPILLDGGKLSFSLDRKTGKKCFMVAARELDITWNGEPEYWKWFSYPHSRPSEVAKLYLVPWLQIRGKIATRILSKRTKYFAYLVYKLEDGFYGIGYVNAVVRFVDSESNHDAEQRAKAVRFTVPIVTRGDGWMELKMGNFFNDIGEDGDVEALLMEIKHRNITLRFNVQGIEFRPE